MSLQSVSDENQLDESFGPPVDPPFPLYTVILLACIAVVGIAQFLYGLGPSIGAAGFVKPLFAKGEYWRLLTGAALHAGALHLILNGYALFSFGRFAEMLANRAHLAIVFLLAVIGGGALSLIFVPNGISVGASGGIVGIVGYLAVYAFRRKDFISPEFRRGLVVNIGFVFVYGLLLFQSIDNFAHLGGLIAGGIYGFLQIPRDPYTDPRQAGVTMRILGAAAMLIFALVSALSVLLIVNNG